MRISIIVAKASNDVIGRDNGLPWKISADLRRFKQLTMGHHLVMGRRTYESVGRALPGRTTVVMTRREDFQAIGVLVARAPAEALALCAGDDEVFIAGGAEIYAQFLPQTHRLYLTQIHAEIEGDTRFPPLDMEQWRLSWEEAHADAEPWPFSFRIYERATGSQGDGTGSHEARAL